MLLAEKRKIIRCKSCGVYTKEIDFVEDWCKSGVGKCGNCGSRYLDFCFLVTVSDDDEEVTIICSDISKFKKETRGEHEENKKEKETKL